MARAAAGLSLWGTWGVPETARADEISRACADAYVQAQLEKRAGHWFAVRREALLCSTQCPTIMARDCQLWGTDAEQAIPSIVVIVRVDGQERLDAQVEVDGKRLPNGSGARAQELEMGEHRLRVLLPGFPPAERQLLLREGQKRKPIRIDFSASRPTEYVQSRPIPWGVWGLGGIGLVGIAGFVVLRNSADAEKQRLQGSCAPACGTSELDALEARYRMALVSMIVGAVSTGGALGWYLARPVRQVPRPGSTDSIDRGLAQRKGEPPSASSKHPGFERRWALGGTPLPGGFLGTAAVHF